MQTPTHRILEDQTAALIVDVQERLHPHMTNAEELERRLAILVRGLDILSVPYIVTEQYPRGLGSTIPSLRDSIETFSPLEKIEFSCMDNRELHDRLRELDRPRVLIAGIEAHVCVLQTSMDLLDAGFLPTVVADATSSRNEYDKKIALERMSASGVGLTTTESVLFELCRYAGTETFKAISKLVK